MKKLCLVGQNIDGSLSPKLMKYFANVHDIQIEYSLFDCQPDKLPEVIKGICADEYHGFNVTSPYKVEILNYLDQITDRAKHAGAVNTVILSKGRLCGDNTDGIGLVKFILKNTHLSLSGKKILILGAGGVVRGILRPLLSLSPSKIVIANRNLDKSESLADYFSKWGKVRSSCYSNLNKHNFDIVINATSMIGGVIPPLPVNFNFTNAFFIDLNYGARSQLFKKFIQQHDIYDFVNGFGMLCHQAAASFQYWFDLRTTIDDTILDNISELV